MPKLIITRGIPGSGKSTAARKAQIVDPNLKRVNRDDLRAMLHNSVWSAKNEDMTSRVQLDTIQTLLNAGYDVIVDDTNLRNSRINELVRLLPDFDHSNEVEVWEFYVPIEVCYARNAERTGVARVPDAVIEKMHRDLENARRNMHPYTVKEFRYGF